MTYVDKKKIIITMSGSDTLKLFDIMFRPFTDNACESDTKCSCWSI